MFRKPILFRNSKILVLDLPRQFHILISPKVSTLLSLDIQGCLYRTCYIFKILLHLTFCLAFVNYWIFFILAMGPGMSSQPSGMGSQYGYPQMQQHMAVQQQYLQAAVAMPQQQPMQPQLTQAAQQSVAHAGSDGAHQQATPSAGERHRILRAQPTVGQPASAGVAFALLRHCHCSLSILLLHRHVPVICG